LKFSSLEYEIFEFDQYYNPKYFIDQVSPRFELAIKDLQSRALPLGHAAKKSNIYVECRFEYVLSVDYARLFTTVGYIVI
jgi:hypothetical protein